MADKLEKNKNTKKPKKANVFKKLVSEYRQLNKPAPKAWLKGTVFTCLAAVASAVTVSAFDSVFTAIVDLFV